MLKGFDLSISEKTDLLVYSLSTISRVYRNGTVKEKNAVSSDSVVKNALMAKV